MSYTYATFAQALAIEMAVPQNNPADPQFAAILQTLIDMGEQRCYRDLDLLYATSTQTIALTPGAQILDFSTLSPPLIILEDIWVVLPATETDPELGERMPVAPVSKELLRMIYGVSSTQGPPVCYAMLDDRSVLLGPPPDLGYTAELRGKFRPTPLYATPPANGSQTTFLTTTVPDLFLAACMVAAAAYQHNFGATADDPRMATSWDGNYQTLLRTAKAEEQRKRFHGWMGLTSEPPPAPPGGAQ